MKAKLEAYLKKKFFFSVQNRLLIVTGEEKWKIKWNAW